MLSTAARNKTSESLWYVGMITDTSGAPEDRVGSKVIGTFSWFMPELKRRDQSITIGRSFAGSACMSAVRVSVIVATHNRGEILRENIESVLNQPGADFEAIYSDDASTDGTSDILAEYARSSGGRLRAVRSAGGGPGIARNTAAREAKGDFLLMTDDDVVVPSNWIEGMLALRHRSRADTLCGGFDAYSLDSKLERYLHYRAQIGFGARPHFVSAVPMMNFLISRALFEELGGFDPDISHNSEDWEFCLRLAQRGKTIYYDPGVAVRHRYQTDWDGACRRVRNPAVKGLYIRRMHGRPLFPLVAYTAAKCAASPLWAPRYFPLDLYPLAIAMEGRFFAARAKAYWNIVTGNDSAAPKPR
ncbi:MAG: hypothetical protein AMXMBFR84_30620 [Candidatus Hydrogenedentota bacterium]